MTILIIGNTGSLVLCIVLQTICNYLTGKIFDDLFIMRGICIDDQCSVSGKQLGKFAEGMTDVINILEKVQVIRINIQDNADLWEKA